MEHSLVSFQSKKVPLRGPSVLAIIQGVKKVKDLKNIEMFASM